VFVPYIQARGDFYNFAQRFCNRHSGVYFSLARIVIFVVLDHEVNIEIFQHLNFIVFGLMGQEDFLSDQNRWS
jgi:hypothetical protein